MFIREHLVIQNVNRHAFLKLGIFPADLKLPGITLAPIIQRPFLNIIFVEQLHLNVNQLSVHRLGPYIKYRLLIQRIILICIWIEQHHFLQRKIARIQEYLVQKSEQYILVALACKNPLKYKIHPGSSISMVSSPVIVIIQPEKQKNTIPRSSKLRDTVLP